MAKKRVVVALGHEALGTILPEQKKAAKASAKVIADLIEAGANVVVSHSNAPQVGMIHTAMNEFSKAHEGYTGAPMSVCSAMSQGYIGYDLQNAIRAELLKRGIYKPVSTVLTQVLVDPYDEAFYTPSKVVGRYMTKEEADAEEKKGNYVVQEEKGYRRIVAAPKPRSIIEIDTVRTLLDAGHVVIAAGGGGIPVLEQGVELRGASAVIEKDLACGKLAEMLDADSLLILTGVEKVYLNYQKEDQEPLTTVCLDEARKYVTEGQFEEKTMLPKIEASIAFVESGVNRQAVITSLEKAKDGFRGKAGTIITE